MDLGISASQTVNYEEINGDAYYNRAINPASASVAVNTVTTDGILSDGVAYYMRPSYVLVDDHSECHEIKFMFSGSLDTAKGQTGPGWVSFGSASYQHSGSLRLDISPLAWTGTECEGSNLNADCGSGSVVFVYANAGRTL